MHIAFESSSISTDQPTGISGYATALIEELLKTQSHNSFTLLNKLSRFKKRHKLYQHKSLPQHFYLPHVSALLHRFDVLHSLDAYIPAWPGTKKITTIHDIFVLLNQDHEFFPASFIKRKKNNYHSICQRTDAIIAVSQSTKDDIVNCLGFPADRIFVTHLGVDDQYHPRGKEEINSIKTKYRIAADYLLFVGNITPRKNTQRIIKAFDIAALANNLQLVLCGAMSFNSQPTSDEIKKRGLESKIKLLNYVDKADLPALYSGAQGFVYPTLYEGFGIPPLEAMACATPVLSSYIGAAPEVCGSDAILVDPYNIDAIADGMQRLLSYSEQDIANAKTRAASYTWQQCAEQTLSAYRKTLEINH